MTGQSTGLGPEKQGRIEGRRGGDGGQQPKTHRPYLQALLAAVTLQWRSRGVGVLVGDQWIPHLRAIPDGQLGG